MFAHAATRHEQGCHGNKSGNRPQVRLGGDLQAFFLGGRVSYFYEICVFSEKTKLFLEFGDYKKTRD